MKFHINQKNRNILPNSIIYIIQTKDYGVIAMKKIFLLAAILLTAALVAGWHVKKPSETVQLYFVDSSMLRLIPSDFEVGTKNPSKAAKIVINELLRGRDDNDKILRLIPNVKNGLSVKVRGTTAYVNMSDEFVRLHSDIRRHEILTIYSIVDSLTSVDGIVNVKFTIDGREEKDFKGFCDMRETFIPDYYI